MSERYTLGVDLGTTNTCAAVVVGDEVRVIRGEDRARTHPSIVAFLEDGSLRVGAEARPYLVGAPEDTIFSAKRLIGRNVEEPEIAEFIETLPYEVVGRESGAPMIYARGQAYAPPEIAALILRHIKDLAEAQVKGVVEQAVITVPANFNDRQRHMTKLAGRLAGLEVIRIINEPTAAALAYGFAQDLRRRLVVYDFGGGTFDVTLLEIEGYVFEVLASAGDAFLGGDDFDARLTRSIHHAFERQYGISLRDQPLASARLKQVAERLKLELSARPAAVVNIHELAFDEDGAPLGLRFQVDRPSLERNWKDLVDRSLEVCQEALASARLKPEDVDGVILVGGMTRMPLIRRRVASFFRRDPYVDIDPDEVVAVGAAIQAHALVEDLEASGDLEQPLLIDVVPMAVGVQTVAGIYEQIIPKDAALPYEKTRTFTTTVDRQTEVRVQIFQGPHRKASLNTRLGEVILTGLRPAPRGQVEIVVIFEVDTDGIILVTARDRETNREANTQIELTASYSDGEVAEMMERM